MSEIPEDIMQAATAAHADFARSSVTDNLTVIIAKAILAERQRCIDVAEAEFEKRFENTDGYPGSRVHDFIVVARSIEQGIRKGGAA